MSMGVSADIGEVFMETRYSHPVGPRTWRDRALVSFLGMAACLFLPLAMADTAGGPTITPEQALLVAPFVDLGSIESQPGEGLDAFVLKTAGVIHDFTLATGHEACGVLMVANADPDGSNGPWRVRLTTNRSHIACILVEYADAGYRRLGPGIHSHPYLPGGFNINPQDERWRKPKCQGNEDKCQAMLESAPRCGDDWKLFDSRFSARDFQHGPGYLVTRGRVLYQHGDQYPVRMLGNVGGEQVVALSFQGQGAERARLSAVAVAAWQGGEDEQIPAISCTGPGARYSRP